MTAVDTTFSPEVDSMIHVAVTDLTKGLYKVDDGQYSDFDFAPDGRRIDARQALCFFSRVVPGGEFDPRKGLKHSLSEVLAYYQSIRIAEGQPDLDLDDPQTNDIVIETNDRLTVWHSENVPSEAGRMAIMGANNGRG